MNILLADDDVNFGRVLKMELERDGRTVDLVPNGVDAVLNFLSKDYNMVLLDIKMPRLNGTDTLRILKRLKPNTPVIAFSGNAGSAEIKETIQCGALKCFSKPFPIAELKGDLRSYFDQVNRSIPEECKDDHGPYRK